MELRRIDSTERSGAPATHRGFRALPGGLDRSGTPDLARLLARADATPRRTGAERHPPEPASEALVSGVLPDETTRPRTRGAPPGGDPPHDGAPPGPGCPAEPELDPVLPDDWLEACPDSALVDAIRECERLRHRLLRDQLALCTEARRRGLRLPPGPQSAPAPAPRAEEDAP